MMQEELPDYDSQKQLSNNPSGSVFLEERSELVQEIISARPNFTERWALLFFILILLVLTGLSWFVKYPDIIQSNAVLTAQNAPKEIIAKQDGRLIKIFVTNNQEVKKNQVLGWLEATADAGEMQALSSQIDSCLYFLNTDQIQKVVKLSNKRYRNLGEIQAGYQQLVVAEQQFNDYLVNGFYQNRRKSLEYDIHSIDATRKSIESQKALMVEDLKLAKESFEMNKKLAEQKVITREEFRREQSKYVNKQLTIPQLDASLRSNDELKSQKIKDLDQLDHDLGQQRVLFIQNLQSLKSEVDDWTKKHVLIAPVAGKVSFIVPLQEDQYLKSGKLLGYVTPLDSHFYAESYLSQTNFGKLDTGLAVQLRFDAYPYQETGVVDGKINYISSVPSDSGFLATIKLTRGLVTSNNIAIPYKNGLKARAIIITHNMRLVDRVYFNVVKSISIGKE